MEPCRYTIHHWLRAAFTYFVNSVDKTGANFPQVTKRDDDVPESVWHHWNWVSDGDLMLNGAFFRASSEARTDNLKAPSFARSAPSVPSMTSSAGALSCKEGSHCWDQLLLHSMIFLSGCNSCIGSNKIKQAYQKVWMAAKIKTQKTFSENKSYSRIDEDLDIVGLIPTCIVI